MNYVSDTNYIYLGDSLFIGFKESFMAAALFIVSIYLFAVKNF